MSRGVNEDVVHIYNGTPLRNETGSSAEALAPHSSTLAWKIPGMEEPGRLQSMGSLSQT